MAIAYNTSIARNGLVLHLDAANVKSYPGSGSTWGDISGNNNNATLVNIPIHSSTNSGIFTFDGVDEYASGAVPVFPVGSSATIEAMVRLNDVTNLSCIFTHGRSGSSFDIGMVVTGSNLRFRNSSNDHALSSPSTLVTGQWYHLVLSITPSLTTGYRNGLSQGTTSQVITSNAITDYHISRRSSNSATEHLNGNIALIRVYNRALSAEEVLRNFEATRGRYGI
jgi:hypothetical protein